MELAEEQAPTPAPLEEEKPVFTPAPLEEEKPVFTTQPDTGDAVFTVEEPAFAMQQEEQVKPFEQQDNAVESMLSGAAGATNYDEVKFNADLKEQERRNTAIQAAVFSTKAVPSEMTKQITEILKSPLTRRTVGDAAADMLLNNHSKEEKQAFSSTISVDNAKTINKDAIQQTFGKEGSSYKETINAKEPSVNAIVAGLEASHKTIEDGVEPPGSIAQFFEYINPIGGEDEAGMDMEVWQSIKDIFTGDFDADAFGTRMESNYGKEWGKRFLSMAAKEVAIDGAILLGAFMYPPAAVAMAYGKAAMTARLAAASARALIIAAGGTAAQVTQNAGLGRDSNLILEFGLRAGGSIATDGLIYGVRGGIRAGRAAGAKNRDAAAKAYAEENNIKPISREEVDAALDIDQFKGSASSAQYIASLRSDVKLYTETVGETAEAVLTRHKASESIRRRVASYMGKDITELDNTDLDVMIPVITKMGDEFDAGAPAAFGNQKANSRMLASRLLYSIIGEYDTASRLTEGSFSRRGASLRDNDININSTSTPFIDNIMKAAHVAEAPRFAKQSGQNRHTALDFTAALESGQQTLYRDAVSGIKTKKDQQILESILQEGDDAQKTFDFVHAKPERMHNVEIPDNVKVAYAKLRWGEDVMFEINDKAAVDSLKATVFKHKGKYYETYGPVKDGYKKSRVYNRRNMNSVDGEDFAFPWAEREEITTIMSYRNGHIARGMRAHEYSALVTNKDGTVAREVVFDSIREANEWKAERMKSINKETEAVVVVSRNKSGGNSGIRTDRDSVKVMDTMEESRKEALRESLGEFNLDADQMAFFDISLRGNKPTATFTKGRTTLGTSSSDVGKKLRLELGKERAKAEPDEAAIEALEDAIVKDVGEHRLPPLEAIIEYYSTVARKAGSENFRVMAIKDINDRYSQFFAKGARWDDKDIKWITGEGAPSKAVMEEGKRYSRWLKRAVTGRTEHERRFDNAVVDWKKQFAEGDTLVAKATTAAMDAMIPTLGKTINILKWPASAIHLRMMAIAQVAVQGLNAVNALGVGLAHPTVLAKAMFNLPKLTAIAIADHTKVGFSRATLKSPAYRMYKEIERAGYAADLRTTDTLFLMESKINPSIGSQLWQNIKNAPGLPFKLGEGANRITSFVLIRDLISTQVRDYEKLLFKGVTDIKRLSKAEVLDSNGKVMRAADIGEKITKDGKFEVVGDSAEGFVDAVVQKAAVVAFNMSKSGEVEAATGIGSVLFQFKPVIVKQMSMFTSSQLTWREKLGVLTGLTTTFGAGGLVLGPDLLGAADSLWYNALGAKPSDVGKVTIMAKDAARSFAMFVAENGGPKARTTELFLESGAIAAMTDGEINLASRVGLGSFWSDSFAVATPGEFIVMVSATRDIAHFIEVVSGLTMPFPGTKEGESTDITGFAKDVGSYVLEASALFNPFSYIDIVARLNKGEDFKEIIKDSFDPKSIIGQLLASDITLGQASLEALRASPLSATKGIYRVMEAHNRELSFPSAYSQNKIGRKFYHTKRGTNTGVESTEFRDWLSVLGLSPGPLIEHWSEEKKDRAYTDAIKVYTKNMKDEIIRFMGDPKMLNKLTHEFSVEIENISAIAVERGFGDKVTNDARETMRKTLNNVIAKFNDPPQATGAIK
jgi:hypothetical protein